MQHDNKVTRNVADAALKVLMGEEPDNQQFTQELEKNKVKASTKKSPEDEARVAKGNVDAVDTVKEELKGGQKNIDMNKNGKIDAEDFKMLRKKKPAKRVVHSDRPDSLVSMKVSKEEVEELDELSPKTLGSYATKAGMDARSRAAHGAGAYMMGSTGEAKQQADKSDKRMAGVKKAINKLTKEQDESLEEGKLKDLVTGHMDDGHSFDTAMKKAQADLNKMAVKKASDEHPEAKFRTNPLKPVMSKSDRESSKKNLGKLLNKKMQKEANKPSPAMADAFAKLRAGGSRIQDGPSNVTKTSTGLIHRAKLAKGPKYGVTDFTKNVEDSEAEGPKGTKRKGYGARQNKVRSTRVSGKDVNESFGFTAMLESYQEKGLGFIKQMNEEIELLDEKNKPTNPALWARAKAAAKSKFDVYPSAYANGWAAKWYKKRGGGWKSVKEEVEQIEEATPTKKEVKQGIGIARDKRYAKGNMSGAVKAMDKVNKGIAQHPAVAKELRKQNESSNFKDLRHQLDELSPKTLGSYAQKSVRDLEKRDRAMGKATQRDREVVDPETSKPFQKMAKRRSGLTKAINRLSKEDILAAAYDEIEQLEEGTPSKKQVKQGIGIARDKRYAKGNMSGAVKAMDKVNKGLAQHPAVAKELRKQNEDIEYIDELKTPTLKSYISKASKDIEQKQSGKGYPFGIGKDKSKIVKRDLAIDKAKGRLSMNRQLGRPEESVQIDELDTKTLMSYRDKAEDDQVDRAMDMKGNTPKARKRAMGIEKAKDRLRMKAQKEEVEYIEEKNVPTNPKLWSRAKSLAKQKFDVYPSAYANGWASKWYKSKGGSWRKG